MKDDPELTYDADFTQLHKSHREYEKENELRREQSKYYVIKSKYFKDEKQPNFLTWAEREQILHLNKTEPDEWTPERLAQSFPAVEESIIKILKSKWKPYNMKATQKHDQRVKRNWELFKTNQMKNLDPDVKKHLQKFSDRKFDNFQNAYIQTENDQIEFKFPKPKSSEFLHIVSSCKGNNANLKKQSVVDTSNAQIKEHNSLLAGDVIRTPVLKLPKNTLKENITSDQLIGSTKQISSKSENIEMHLSVSLSNEPNQTIKTDAINTSRVEAPKIACSDQFEEKSTDEKIIDLTKVSSSKKISKYASKSSSLMNTSSPYSFSFRHKIEIPKRLQKLGTIYKLHDCFYDDRGAFLYRVPGLRE